MRGGCGLLSFTAAASDSRQLERSVNGFKLFRLGVSWGGYESLVMPGMALTNDHRNDLGRLVWLHVGLEDPDALVADLDRCLHGLM